MKAFGFAAILVSVCAMAACQVTSGEGGDGGAGGEGGTTTTTTTTTGEGGGTGGTGGGEGGGDTTNACAEETGDACFNCCSTEHAAENEELGKLMYWHCGCVAESPCADVCDTTDAESDVCGDTAINPDVDNANCDACVADAQETNDCYFAAADACREADGCKALMTCGDACQ
ncbi:hypothetical protein WMF31_11585 [Sorangium sp. So ce1036]|uniref:hypothetical protein n=1 Tax=Sorangium sp. So ce1036 TaxID=3133328 RepID=UPI003F074057